MRLLDPLLEPGSTAVDVGAQYGVYAYFFARRGLKVEAFEPLPAHAVELRAMPSRLVRVHQIALSDRPSSVRLVVPREHGTVATGRARIVAEHEPRALASAAMESYSVQARTLDSYAFIGISVIKIDVEGHEFSVLRGADETLRRNRPLLLVELELRHIGGGAWRTLVEWLEARDYAGFFSTDGRVVQPIARFDSNAFQTLVDGEPVGRYVNNFIFVPTVGRDVMTRARVAWQLA